MPSSPSWHTALPWPLAVIDFEASSLDQDGYPIEVGLALWSGPEDPIFSWSSLIQPVGEWSRGGHWSSKSAKVHGILSRDLVAHGYPVDQVAAALNDTLGAETTAWCDGDAYDALWTGALFKAAEVTPVFVLGDWHRLMALLDLPMRERGLAWLKQVPARHRAREDAERLLLALAHAMGAEPGPIQDLAERQPALATMAGTIATPTPRPLLARLSKDVIVVFNATEYVAPIRIRLFYHQANRFLAVVYRLTPNPEGGTLWTPDALNQDDLEQVRACILSVRIVFLGLPDDRRGRGS